MFDLDYCGYDYYDYYDGGYADYIKKTDYNCGDDGGYYDDCSNSNDYDGEN